MHAIGQPQKATGFDKANMSWVRRMQNRGAVISVFRCTLVIPLIAVSLHVETAAGDSDKRDHASVAVDPKVNEIARQVRYELLMLPYYGVFDDLCFRVDVSTITLTGEVTRPKLKSDAENAIRRIEGVNSVENVVEVLPVSPTDDQIRLAEFHAIYGDPALAVRYGRRAVPPVHIIVKNGHVTLVGVVGGQPDKDLVETRAKSVRDAFSVTNNVRVADR